MVTLFNIIGHLLLLLVNNAVCKENSFLEELIIKPLQSGHIYSHFEFTTHWSNLKIEESILNYKNYEFIHYDFFPRALGEIIEKYHVRELHLSLTQGLWNHHQWGYPVSDAPPGAQLYAWFNPNSDDIDQLWKDLVNALSGLFCASLNFIDNTNTVSPELSFRPHGIADEWYSRNSSYMRYAALPRENVCTENLTPWKKLLCCNTKSGLSTLLRPTPLYSAHYHSLSVHLRPSCKNEECSIPQLELVQSLSVVQKLFHEMGGKQDWTLKKLFTSPLISVCPLAKSSKIYVDVTENKGFVLNPPPTEVQMKGKGMASRSYAVYNLYKLVDGSPFNLEVKYKKKHIYNIIKTPPLEVSRFITGHGQEGGSITVKLTNNESQNLTVIYFEVLPWYLRIFFHSSDTGDVKNSIRVSKLITGQDRVRGWLYEGVLTLPPKSTTMLRLEFTRALLKWLEYPPDANHGFYVPAAIVSVILPSARNITTNEFRSRSLMDKLTLFDGPSFIRISTETLLVSLPTPDFSMPYNVICLACTVVALAFGPIHNITTKRLTVKKIERSSFSVSMIYGKVKQYFAKKKPLDESNDLSKDNQEITS